MCSCVSYKKFKKTEIKSLNLTFLDFQKDLPTGVTTWDIPDRICGDSQTERTLFLNSCNNTEFACHDGDCVSISQR